MTFAAQRATLENSSKPILVSDQGIPFDVSNFVQWVSDVATPTIEKMYRVSTAICEPIVELRMWLPHNGLVSPLDIKWDAASKEQAAVQVEAVREEDMLEALLTLDLTIPAYYSREITVTGHVLSAEKWSPTILDPEGFLDVED